MRTKPQKNRMQKTKLPMFFVCEELPRQTVSSATNKASSRRSCEHKDSSAGSRSVRKPRSRYAEPSGGIPIPQLDVDIHRTPRPMLAITGCGLRALTRVVGRSR